MTKFKDCVSFKAADPAGADSGQFEAIVSVFGNIDRAGDVVVPGAFADSLKKWGESGDPIPVLWSHRMDDPRYSIGAVLEAAELGPGDPRIPDTADQFVKDHGGLWVRGQLHTGADAGEIAQAAHKLLRLRLVKQFSYAYDIDDGGPAVHDGRDVFELRKLSVHEISPTQVGCNDLTSLLGAKAAVLAAQPVSNVLPEPGFGLHEVGRLVDGVGQDIRDAIWLLGKNDIERSRDAAAPPDGSDNANAKPVKHEDPDGGKCEEPPGMSAESVRLLCGDLVQALIAT